MMRRVRLTYEGAFHHGMNRGINGENIFEGNQDKSFFLDFLEEAVLKYKIRILDAKARLKKNDPKK